MGRCDVLVVVREWTSCRVAAPEDGKHMEAILEQNVIGHDNSCYFDCGCFQQRDEFKKSGGLAWNKSIVRIQEMDANARFLSDLWKRFVVDEEIFCRVNYGFTEKLKFGESMKDQELNYENIPVIEDAGSPDKVCEQLERRIVCCRMGKARFVNRAADVDEEKGLFLKLPQDELEQFLSHPFTAILYFRRYLLPFFLQHGESGSKRMLMDLKSVSEDLWQDTVWLAGRLSGGNAPPPGEANDDSESHDKIVLTAHKHTPARPFIKEYLVNQCSELPGGIATTFCWTPCSTPARMSSGGQMATRSRSSRSTSTR